MRPDSDIASRAPRRPIRQLFRLTPIARTFWNEDIRVEGYTPKDRDDALLFLNAVSPAYLQTIGTPLLAGRDFTTRDSKNTPPVAIVNETAAKRYFAGANPIGKGYRVQGADGKARPVHRDRRRS
jgi:hypothetical protein